MYRCWLGHHVRLKGTSDRLGFGLAAKKKSEQTKRWTHVTHPNRIFSISSGSSESESLRPCSDSPSCPHFHHAVLCDHGRIRRHHLSLALRSTEGACYVGTGTRHSLIHALRRHFFCCCLPNQYEAGPRLAAATCWVARWVVPDVYHPSTIILVQYSIGYSMQPTAWRGFSVIWHSPRQREKNDMQIAIQIRLLLLYHRLCKI